MTFTLIVDLIVIGLLGATLVYALRLNKQLSSLYQARGELQTFLEGFTGSLTKAESSMQALRSTGETTFSAVHEALSKAQALRDDLSYLVERGETIASHLDEAIREARSLQKELENQKQLKPSPEEPSSLLSEPEILRHLRNVR